jgi:hypothetical protein
LRNLGLSICSVTRYDHRVKSHYATLKKTSFLQKLWYNFHRKGGSEHSRLSVAYPVFIIGPSLGLSSAQQEMAGKTFGNKNISVGAKFFR